MRRKDRDTYVLSTGREIKADRGIVGIARAYGETSDGTFETFEITEGFGSHLNEMREVDQARNQIGFRAMTPAERMELADFMAAQWLDVKRHAAAAIGPLRRVSSVGLEVERGVVRMRLECRHEAEVQLEDPVLAVTESQALPKVG